jgi:hypothetical protein
MTDIANAARNALRKQLESGMTVSCVSGHDGREYRITPEELLLDAIRALPAADCSALVLLLTQGKHELVGPLLARALSEQIDVTVKEQINDWLNKELAA